ncbi:phenazine biosynthesis-like domain-containing protein 1 [Oryzias melastigma]|uniref:phenazine biosynthesis-like domain-containing protein 1 n=1 Tax=Oryzias melastigma TaxID=30732 RepID=UPI000CF8185F|nr:phenazine biosynthesis-like domain-containing protein 1 [Oryzias melastigma]
MNLSETAFITRTNPSDTFATGSKFHLRWFTPTTEVNLCGHATLASAAALFLFERVITVNLNPHSHDPPSCPPSLHLLLQGLFPGRFNLGILLKI